MTKPALKLVSRPSFFTEEVELWPSDPTAEAHSLHYSLSLPVSSPPEFASFAINKYTRKGEVVCDPFVGTGTVALEAALGGRIFYASDLNPLYLQVARAKLQPVDITEVTLRLQAVNVRRPVALESFRKGFTQFFDVDTYRELVSVRCALNENVDRVSRFIELATLGVLHGHTAGHLSVYTLPQVAVSIEEQEQLNFKRRQSPEFRAVVPRVLRRTAMMLRDGIPSVLGSIERKSMLKDSDARSLDHVPSSSVHAVVSVPPIPGTHFGSEDQWLRNWFLGISAEEFNPEEFSSTDLESWLHFMEEVLHELARVVIPFGKCVFKLSPVKISQLSVDLDQELLQMVERRLSKVWESEALFVHTPRVAKLRHTIRPREQAESPRVVVLRRK